MLGPEAIRVWWPSWSSKPVRLREGPGGFDSRPPPLKQFFREFLTAWMLPLRDRCFLRRHADDESVGSERLERILELRDDSRCGKEAD